MINAKWKKYMERNGIEEKCEICGSRKLLEVHHILSRVIVGDVDCDENLICICEMCHRKITPRSLLIRMGMRQKLAPKYLAIDFYSRLEKSVQAGACSASDVCDVFDEFLKENFGGKETPFACYYRGKLQERPTWDGF